MQKRLTAEFIGTFWLTFGGCGSAILAAAFPALGIGFVGVSLAFGLTVLTMAYGRGVVWSAVMCCRISRRKLPVRWARRPPCT